MKTLPADCITAFLEFDPTFCQNAMTAFGRKFSCVVDADDGMD
jgi:hypothetical protein